jgi:hypothetical protein
MSRRDGAIDRGRDHVFKVAPPSEPDWRFSRISALQSMGSTVRLSEFEVFHFSGCGQVVQPDLVEEVVGPSKIFHSFGLAPSITFFKAPQHRVALYRVFNPGPSGTQGFFILLSLLFSRHSR